MQRKAKKCGFCKSEFQPFNTMQKTCAKAKCAVGYVRLQESRERVKAQRKFNAETRRRKQELNANDRRYQLRELQKEFNAYIRERDKDLPCICCGKWPDDSELITGSRWDAGHYRSIGANPELRFNEDNCHRQRVVCNRNLSGNVANYRIGLIERIGLARVEALEGPHKPKRYTLDEIKELRQCYKTKLKELRKRPVGEPNIQPESADAN